MSTLIKSITNNFNYLSTRFIRKNNISKSRKNSATDSKKSRATRKIQKFMKTYRPKMRAMFLNSICSDSGVCIAFGKESKRIKEHFDGFGIQNHISNIKRIGKESMNGFINELTYEREGYKSHTIMKSAMNPDSDNLYFEYLVGQYVNKINLLYPCFLETYGCYLYKDEYGWNIMTHPNKNTKLHNILIPFSAQSTTTPSIKSRQSPRLASKKSAKDELSKFGLSCKKSKYIALMIQHIQNATTLYDKISKSPHFNDNELVYVLYQVYMALSCQVKKFTHYDLHANNVLVFVPVEGKYIEYHYHHDKEEVVFKSKYMVKIIDYGRCFFKDDENKTASGSSEKIIEEICKSKDCEYEEYNEDTGEMDAYDCGTVHGYSWMQKPSKDPRGEYHISSAVRNASHDLKTLYDLKRNLQHSKRLLTRESLRDFFKKIVYCQKLLPDSDCFGTIENLTSGLPNKINNVIDAHDALLELVKNEKYVNENQENHENMEKLGELHVYYDGRPMEFIETSHNDI